MGRALALLLLLGLSRAWAQTASCDATDLLFDFSGPGPLQTLTVGGQSYYVANRDSYLLLLSGTSPMRFLPTLARPRPSGTAERRLGVGTWLVAFPEATWTRT